MDAPNAPVEWDEMRYKYSWWRDMEACPQDVIHHGEGDVATHTRMVWDTMTSDAEYQSLPHDAQGVLRLAALLHDIGKPDTTRTEDDGRITARGHSRKGEVMARRLLWEAGNIPVAVRESVCALIRWHQHPFWLIERETARARRDTIAISSSGARCDYLAVLATADARGRICDDADRLLLNVGLFAELARDLNCLSIPYPFGSDHSRVCYFRDETQTRDPAYQAHDDTQGEMILLSGLPGAGKDTYVKQQLSHLPVVSLDALRAELGVLPSENQEPVLYAAREKARIFLRSGATFVWNATNLSRELRQRSLALAADYKARVRVVYVESPEAQLWTQNRNRENAVPQNVLERMLSKWEPPDLTEAHEIIWAARENS